MSLARYRKKRDFRRTPEPKGAKLSRQGRQFVVQKHAARRLHYDFRLELGGVLKSWAVPKGPSLDPHVKSLAVQVEDHPLEYASFEGVIPQGEYGGGTVLLWDRGTWQTDVDNPLQALSRGKLKFHLQGEKLSGGWTLVRMRDAFAEKNRAAGGKNTNWLLIKTNDNAARSSDVSDVLQAKSQSVATGRTMDEIASQADSVWTSDGKTRNGDERRRRRKRPPTSANGEPSAAPTTDPAAIKQARRGKIPAQFKPQLATLVKRTPDGDQWLHELKLDGYRLLGRIRHGKAQLLTRRGNDWTSRFPAVAAAMEKLGFDETLLDGEVVVLDRNGTTDFQALQNAMKRGRDAAVVFYAFDLPFFQGYDLTDVPLIERKKLLARILAQRPDRRTLRYNDHIAGRGAEVFRHACRETLEGVVSKQADSKYEQRRAASWVKAKCLKRQEFVIGGWTKPSGSRKHFGALLLGYYENGRLAYCGRVGTGFARQTLANLKSVLDELAAPRSPFDEPPTAAEARGVQWVAPRLVAEVEFGDWTNDRRLRHAAFLGLREDKEPRQVIFERPIDAPEASLAGARPSAPAKGAVRVAGVRLSHPERVLYPETGLTKHDLAEYYAAIADWILPHVVRRPLTLLRCPRGAAEKCFYQKHYREGVAPPIHPIEIEEEGAAAQYLFVRDLAGLISLVQLGALEIHPWGSRNDKLDRPDRMIFDLDPSENVPRSQLVEAARELHERLERLELRAFLRTTGGKGFHLVVPLLRRNTWDEVKAASKAIAEAMVRDTPDKYLATSSKAKRKGKIFIDYLRNSRGATAVVSYSPRARSGAPVAAPIRWDELTSALSPNQYDVRTLPQRLAALTSDPWQGFFDVRQSITKAMLRKLSG